eukprot:scpid45019/ scgid30243/ 
MAHNQAPDAAANAAVGGANGGAMVVRPAVMPEAYDGVGDWVEYLQYFNQCARVNEWNDVQKAQYLAVRLRGAAQKFVATVPEARRMEWPQVVEDLSRRFAPPETARQYKSQFRTRRRKPEEDVSRLADDLRSLVHRAYPTMGGDVQEELVRDQLIDSMTPDRLRLRLQENAQRTVQETIEMANHLERVWGNEGTHGRMDDAYGVPRQLVTAAVAPSELPTLEALAKLVEKLSDQVDRIAHPPRPNQQFRRGDQVDRVDHYRPEQSRGLTCWFCGRMGHRRADCPDLMKPGREYQSRRPAGNGH